MGVFRHQCKKEEIRIVGGKCIEFKEREMKYEEEVKGLEKWL